MAPDQITFRGEVVTYGHIDDDGDWVVWADPFGSVGAGDTWEAALAELQEGIKWLLVGTAEALREHVAVHLFTPLSDELKDADRIDHFIIEVVCATPDVAAAGEHELSDLVSILESPCTVEFEAAVS